MSRIFLSHSSADNAEAVALRDWLNREGWDDIFLDVDPDRGIAAGERWERALSEAANRCEAVLFVVSRAWLASDWCVKEFNLAYRLNKKLFGVLVAHRRSAGMGASECQNGDVARAKLRTGPSQDGSRYVIRGGSWAGPAHTVRSDFRHDGTATDRWNDRGFRVARPLTHNDVH